MPNPLVLLALLLPIDVVMGGQATPFLVLVAALLCLDHATSFPKMVAALSPEKAALIGFLLAQRLRHPLLVSVETGAVVLVALLAPPLVAIALTGAALLDLTARRKVAWP